MRREEGGGLRMGNMCIPVVDSCLYMAKPIQYCKVKKIIIQKKRNENRPLFLIFYSQTPNTCCCSVYCLCLS